MTITRVICVPQNFITRIIFVKNVQLRFSHHLKDEVDKIFHCLASYKFCSSEKKFTTVHAHLKKSNEGCYYL